MLKVLALGGTFSPTPSFFSFFCALLEREQLKEQVAKQPTKEAEVSDSSSNARGKFPVLYHFPACFETANDCSKQWMSYLSEAASLCDLVAADSGLLVFRSLGLVPHKLVGDFDSLSKEDLSWAQAEGVQLLASSPVKNETDGELALRALTPQAGDQLFVLGAHSLSRPDHSQANRNLLLPLVRQGVQLFFTDGRQLEAHLYGEGEWGFSFEDACRPDLISCLAEERVKALQFEGLAYPFHRPYLEKADILGLSNCLELGKSFFKILQKEGWLVLHFIYNDGKESTPLPDADFLHRQQRAILEEFY